VEASIEEEIDKPGEYAFLPWRVKKLEPVIKKPSKLLSAVKIWFEGLFPESIPWFQLAVKNDAVWANSYLKVSVVKYVLKSIPAWYIKLLWVFTDFKSIPSIKGLSYITVAVLFFSKIEDISINLLPSPFTSISLTTFLGFGSSAVGKEFKDTFLRGIKASISKV